MLIIRVMPLIWVWTCYLPVLSAALSCQTRSKPNPIVQQYPKEVTGTINGTTAIIPIPYDLARSIVPSQYGILTRAYQALIPNFPSDMYPAEFEGVLDHDVQMSGIKIPDFQRIAIHMPFVDRLNDGYTSFKYTLPQLISLNLVAFGGSLFYGQTSLAEFDPPCDGYVSDGKGSTYLTAYKLPASKALGSKPALASKFKSDSGIPFSLELFKNVTNQPTFGSGIPVCDNYITLFNSSVTTGPYEPVPVRGEVTVTSPFFPFPATFTNVWGLRMDNAFIERNSIPCEQLRGYSGTGSGD